MPRSEWIISLEAIKWNIKEIQWLSGKNLIAVVRRTHTGTALLK